MCRIFCISLCKMKIISWLTTKRGVNMKGDEKHQIVSALGTAAFMGLNMVANIGAGLLLGRFIDSELGWYPWATVVGIVLGMLSGLWGVYKRIVSEHIGK